MANSISSTSFAKLIGGVNFSSGIVELPVWSSSKLRVRLSISRIDISSPP